MSFDRAFMEWSKIDIEFLDINRSFTDELEEYPSGLDGNAETSHKEFIANTETFSELRREHLEFLNSNLNDTEDQKERLRNVHSISSLVDIFGGKWNPSEISLPIETMSPENIILERRISENTEYIRLIIPEKFGGVVNTFELPNGTNISSVKWERGTLKLAIKD